MLQLCKSGLNQLLFMLSVVSCMAFADDNQVNMYDLSSAQSLLTQHRQEIVASEKASPTNQALSQQLVQQGFVVEAENALTLSLDKPMSWGHATVYKRSNEFNDDYTIATEGDSPYLAFSGALDYWKLGGSITPAKLIQEKITGLSPVIKSVEYQLFDTRFSIQMQAQSSCNTKDSYPIEIALNLHIKKQNIPLAKSYDDEVSTDHNAEGAAISCNEFLTQTLKSENVAFAGDLNGDHLLDLIISSQEKGCHDITVFLGNETKGKFELIAVASDGACGC